VHNLVHGKIRIGFQVTGADGGGVGVSQRLPSAATSASADSGPQVPAA
jgi:hypothetical protein